MKNIRDTVIEILNEIDDEIVEYDGDNLIDAGFLDSFTIVTIITMVEDKLHITISPDEVKECNFKSVDAIVQLVIDTNDNR